jgi:hypothetical protein
MEKSRYCNDEWKGIGFNCFFFVKSISSNDAYSPSPVTLEDTSDQDMTMKRDIFNVLLNIKKIIDRPSCGKAKKSEIDFIVKNVAPFVDYIFNANVYIEW